MIGVEWKLETEKDRNSDRQNDMIERERERERERDSHTARQTEKVNMYRKIYVRGEISCNLISTLHVTVTPH